MAVRYEVRWQEPAQWRVWLVLSDREKSVSHPGLATQSEAAEFARNRLRQDGGGTLAVYDARGVLESEEEVPADETGQSCTRAATYQSRCHPEVFAVLEAGDTFPSCDGEGGQAHGTEWIFVVSGPNFGKAVDGERRNA